MIQTALHTGPPPPVHDTIAALANPEAGQRVVDLGCGPGGTLAALAARSPHAVLIGVDISAPRLAETAARVPAAATLHADLSGTLPLADASVDVVISHNVLELLTDPITALSEAQRILKPGARAVISHTDFAGLIVHGADPDLTSQVLHAYAHVQQDWMRHIDPYAARCLPALIAQAGLVLDQFHGHVTAHARMEGQARQRLDEITTVVTRHAQTGATPLSPGDVADWAAQLAHAAQVGTFCFAETALITVSHRPSDEPTGDRLTAESNDPAW